MRIMKVKLRSAAVSALILAASFMISLFIQNIFSEQSLIPALFVLAVFLVSLITESYVCGIISSFISVLAVNFAFTFPYFMFNFTMPENLMSALIMLIVTIMTSTLTAKINVQEKINRESEKEKMRANLLRAVSHDLRTPLTTIYGSCSAIIENYDRIEKENQIKLLKEIQEDAQWLIQMVENLLSVTRIDRENVNIKKTPTVLEELIDSVLIKLKKRYPEQKVRTDIPDEFISIPMDAMLIEQVIVNLLENAIQHARGMKELILRVYISGGRAVFEVEDDGCGINGGKTDNLFDGPGENKNIPADNSKSSMGIGLSVCAAIISAHGSKIHARQKENGGMIFWFGLELEGGQYEQ